MFTDRASRTPTRRRGKAALGVMRGAGVEPAPNGPAPAIMVSAAGQDRPDEEPDPAAAAGRTRRRGLDERAHLRA